MSNLLGTLNYTGGGTNAGSYATNANGLYSTQLGYLITYVSGTLTIDPYAVSLVGSRGYDGSNIHEHHTQNAGDRWSDRKRQSV